VEATIEMKVGASVVGASILLSADALVVSHAPVSGVSAMRTSAIGMRAPFDPRSVTETFAMWTASVPPAGFVWGYDTRSTTETYEQWLTASSEDATEMMADTVTEAAGVPSVNPDDASVQSWYDQGIRLETETTDVTETEASKVEDTDTMEPWVPPDFTQSTIALTDAQIKAYGGAAVRPLTASAPKESAEEEAAEEAEEATLTIATPDFTQSTIALTDAQIKAYGGAAVRPLTPVGLMAPEPVVEEVVAEVEAQEWPMLGGSAGYHRMAGRVTKPSKPEPAPREWPVLGGSAGYHRMAGRVTKPSKPEPAPREWPVLGGSAGYHRMAGRVTKPVLPTAGVVVPTVGVQSWYDEGLRLMSA